MNCSNRYVGWIIFNIAHSWGLDDTASIVESKFCQRKKRSRVDETYASVVSERQLSLIILTVS